LQLVIFIHYILYIHYRVREIIIFFIQCYPIKYIAQYRSVISGYRFSNISLKKPGWSTYSLRWFAK